MPHGRSSSLSGCLLGGLPGGRRVLGCLLVLDWIGFGLLGCDPGENDLVDVDLVSFDLNSFGLVNFGFVKFGLTREVLAWPISSMSFGILSSKWCKGRIKSIFV